jgi:hypothetical protein
VTGPVAHHYFVHFEKLPEKGVPLQQLNKHMGIVEVLWAIQRGHIPCQPYLHETQGNKDHYDPFFMFQQKGI